MYLENEYQQSMSLRLAGAGWLGVPRSESEQAEMKQGETAFSHYAAHCWNQLPTEIRSDPNVFEKVPSIHFYMCSTLLLSFYIGFLFTCTAYFSIYTYFISIKHIGRLWCMIVCYNKLALPLFN